MTREDRFPAASAASIPIRYDLLHVRFVRAALGSLTVATNIPEAYRPYSTTPTSSVDGNHASRTDVSVAAACRMPVGVLGALVSAHAPVETVVVR